MRINCGGGVVVEEQWGGKQAGQDWGKIGYSYFHPEGML
jgi:hypothetical protein